MNPVMLFSLIATNPLSKRAIKKLLEKDGETTRLDKLLRAYAYGENGGFGEMSLLLTVKSLIMVLKP